MHLASAFCQTEAARILVNELNADVFAVDAEGRTPIQIAKLRNSVEIVTIIRNFTQSNAVGSGATENDSESLKSDEVLEMLYRSSTPTDHSEQILFEPSTAGQVFGS